MEFDKRVREMVTLAAVFGFKGYPKDSGGISIDDFVKDLETLFLDTIEKAKPDKASNMNERSIGYNLGIKEFNKRLLKEIKK